MDGNYSSVTTAGVTKWSLGALAEDEDEKCAVCRGVAKWSLTNKTLRGLPLIRLYCWGCLLKMVGLRSI